MSVIFSQNKQRGFTIVELLIVIVVIAILAAISIVAYNGIQQRAKQSEIVSDLSTFSKQVELWKVDAGRYFGTTAELQSIKLRASNPNQIVNSVIACWNSDGSGYAFFMRDSKANYYRLVSGQNPEKVTLAGWSSAQTCGAYSYINAAWGEGWLANFV